MTLTLEQINNLQEVINIGVGEAAGVLNELLNTHITLKIPQLRELDPHSLKKELVNQLGEGNFSTVDLEFFGSIKGNADLVFPSDSAAKLVALVSDEEMVAEMGDDDSDWDSLKIGALTEIGNIVISGVMGSLSNLLSQNLDYLLPNYTEGDIDVLFQNQAITSDSALLLAQTKFFIEKNKIQGEILLIFQVGSLQVLLSSIEKLLS